MEEKPHEHKFVFLREERKNIGYERNPTWQYSDIYFCEGCLEYRKVPTKKTQPHPTNLGGEIEVLG